MNYRIVSAAGTVLRKGYLTAPDARRAQSFEARNGTPGFASSVIETDDGRIRVASAENLHPLYMRSVDPAVLAKARRAGNVRAVLSLLVFAGSAAIVAGFIFAAIVGFVTLYDVVVGN